MPTPDPRRSDPDEDPEALLAGALEAVDAEERQSLLGDVNRYESRVQALEEQRGRLLLLLDLAGGLHRVNRVEDLFDLVLSSALSITPADRAYLLGKDADGTLRVVASRGRDGSPVPADDLEGVSHTVVERVLEKGETLYVSDALTNPDLMSQQSVQAQCLRTVVAVPLPGPGGVVVGALYLDSRTVAGLLDSEEVQLLEAFAAQAALALETGEHRQALEERAQELIRANERLKGALGERSRFGRIVGTSPAMARVFQIMERVVGTSVTVLVQGETGTGKELIAEALHFNGPRGSGSFVPVNCGAIPENLLESELFGHRKGAFTGADRDHVGLVEAADRGTLFLDEIGDLPLPLQVKLLRFLQEGKIRRIGESAPRPVDVRIVTATNRDLRDEMKGGRFREDLYYRINVVTIDLPPLRDRGDDILLLAEHFLGKVREEVDRPGLRFGRDARRHLLTYRWPGNVRELENAIQRAGNLAATDEIEVQDLVLEAQAAPPLPRRGTLKDVLGRTEERAIRDALAETGWNVTQGARLLGVSRQHLHTRMRLFGIERTS